jgi:hypothetical protein
MNQNLYLALLLCMTFSLAACNFGPDAPIFDDDDDSAAAGDDDDATSSDPVEATISQLTAGDFAPESFVTVSGIVTTPVWTDEDPEETDAFFWIQDGTGPGTGIVVYTYRDVVESLEGQIPPGAEVTITGSYILPFEFPELRLTNADNLTVIGSADIPTPHPVSGSDIAGGVADPLLIGTLVSIQGAIVTEGPTYANYYEWEAGGAIVDDFFYYADVQDNYLLTSLSGVMHMSYGDAKLFPRWADDVVYTYPGCDVAWTGNDNVQSLNCRTANKESDASATGLVVVSPETWFGDAFYAVDPATSAFGGILIYSSADDTTIPAIGSIIDVTDAEYDEYLSNSQLKIEGDASITTTGTHSDVASLAVTLADPCSVSEAHEGMLVSIPSVSVLAQDSNCASWGYYKVSGCSEVHVGGEFFADSEAFNSASGGAGTITDLVGVVSARYNVWTINPRDQYDWTTWAAN